ncbi:MAG: isoleucine--tRNA ligase [Endomicrobium sp.]|jgi:isoleucyl-tRNA synthetase|nr:isoleucine--tRNA ligase [Endomicrobium sp.]
MNEKKDYSKTINLPKTDFQMKADLPLKEPAFVDEWDKVGLYFKICEKNRYKKKFIFHDGPPYANAHIHIGTSLNKVLKDFIVKYRSMSGNYVPFTPGWDCHGLPIEQLVLKEMKLDKNKVNKFVFRKQAAKFAKKFVEIQKLEFKRLGIIADWDHPYLTLDFRYEASIIKVFSDLLRKGFIYRKKKPVHWCLTCETAMAEAEVEYEDSISDSIFVKFEIISLPEELKERRAVLKDFSVLIWTTSPWTLPANVALAFNGKFRYVAVVYKFENKKNERLIVAEVLVENVRDKIRAVDFKVVLEIKGDDFIGMNCQNPLLMDKKSQCIIADFVSMENGTGIVHIAPGHGPEDYQASLEYNLEILSPVSDKGFYTKEVQEFYNIHIFKANSLIIDKLEKADKILAKLKLSHSYPHCWRCKNPIIFRATQQWFLSIEHDNLRKKLLKLSRNVSWIPKYGKNRMTAMLKNRPDWCLSRQRLWGVPVPIFYCKECGEPLLNSKIIDKIEFLFTQKGSDSWFEISEKDFFIETNMKCSVCNSTNFKKEEDILDVWFDSGVSYEAVLSSRNYKDLDYPADLYLEGSDQHRGWFQSSMIPSVAIKGKVPYKSVLTHGFVVDGAGKKMSKSLGNVVSSSQLINKHGADVVRLWIASSDYREDIKVSEEIIKGASDTYRKIRNTIRFLLGNISDFNVQKALPFREMSEIDKYALNNLQQLVSSVVYAYEKYEFYRVITLISNFCTVFLSGFYLDVLKDILYCDMKYDKARVSAISAMFEICSVITRLVSPVLSFTAEEAWREIRKFINDQQDRSIFLEDFPMVNNKYLLRTEVLGRWTKILNVRKEALIIYEKLRKNKIIGSNLEASLNIVYGKKYVEVFENLKLINLILGNWDIKFNLSSKENDFLIEATKSKLKKCLRCWKYIDGIKDDLCPRCREVLLSK